MSDNESPKIEPLTEEDIARLTQQIEDTEDFESDLARAVFTIMVVGYEYQMLYTTLQAYYAAASAACHDTAGACAQIIGIRDMKKLQKMYKEAAKLAGNIPLRAQALLEDETQNPTPENEESKDE